MPSTVAKRDERSSLDCSVLESLAPVPRSRRPHFFPRLGRVPSRALQAPECGHPRSLAFEEQVAFVTDGFDPFGSLVPGTDDPSAPFGSTVVARLRELIALLVPTPDAAPLRLLRPRARGPMCRELHERFMPDRARTFKKKDRPSITFLSTELSTGTSLPFARVFTATLVLRGQIARKTAVAVSDVDNNTV